MLNILVAGHPHSGTTWLCWSLAALHDGSTPVGGGRAGNNLGYRVIRTHSAPLDDMLGMPVVLVVRDPRDVAVSLMLRHPHKPPQEIVADLVVQWPETIRRWLPIRTIYTTYEALVENGPHELQNVAFAVFCMEPSRDEAKAALAEYKPPREPRSVGAWREDLDPALARYIQGRIGYMMEMFDYG